jgi:autotransporter-associated beta strand protein
VNPGPNALRLTGASAYTGLTSVTAGELRLDGSLTSSVVNVFFPNTGLPAPRLTGSGSTTGEVVVGPQTTVAPGDGTAGKTLSAGALTVRDGGRIEIDAREEVGTGLVADRLAVAG